MKIYLTRNIDSLVYYFQINLKEIFMKKLFVLILLSLISFPPVFAASEAETTAKDQPATSESPSDTAESQDDEEKDIEEKDKNTATTEENNNIDKQPLENNKTEENKTPTQNTAKPASKEKKTNIKFSIKDPKNLLFKDETIEIYMKKLGMGRDWLNPYYSMQKVLVVNLTDEELNLNGDIFNKVYKEEANQKVRQIAEDKRQKSNAASNVGALNGGLLGAAVIAGSLAADVSIAKGESQLLGQISKLVNDKFFTLKVAPKAEETFAFLIERKNSPVPAIAISYSVGTQAQKYFVQGIDNDLAVKLITTPSLYEQAYLNKQLSEDKKVGIYMINSQPLQQPKATTKKAKEKALENIVDEVAAPEDKAYETAAYIQPINLTSLEEVKKEETPPISSPQEGEKNKAQAKAPKPKAKKQVLKLPEITSKNVFQQKYLRIFAYQNVKNDPRKASLQIMKLTPDLKKAVRQQTQATFAFSFKDVKPGIVEIKPFAVLAPGEYIVKDKDSNIVYDFSISKPEKVSPKKSK